jgi:hypothetical protein
MNKIFFVMSLITVCSFVVAMEQFPSPRQSSPRDAMRSNRPRTSSNPTVVRVKKESLGTHDFMQAKEEFYVNRELEKKGTKSFNCGNFAVEENITPRNLVRKDSDKK